MNTLSFDKMIHTGFKLTVVFFACYFIYSLCVILLIDFPFNTYEIEVVMDSWGLAQGQDLYPLRTEGPIAGLYAPLFNIAIAFAFKIFPNTLVTARCISLLSIVGVVFMLARIIKELPYATWVALFSILVWHPNISEFDFAAKPDSFALFLGIAGVFPFLIKRELNAKILIISAFLISLSIAAKQSMAFVPVGVALTFLIRKEFKLFIKFSSFFVLFTVILWWSFLHTLGDDMWFFVFVQPGTFRMRWAGLFINFWEIQYSPLWWFVLVLIPFYVKKQLINRENLMLFLVTILALPASVLTATKGGGMSNAYQPFFYFMVFLVGWIVSEQWNEGLNLSHFLKTNRTAFLLILTCVMWFTLRPNILTLAFDPSWKYKTWKTYNELVDFLKEKEGTVYAPSDNYLGLKIGKPIRWSYKWEIEARLTKEQYPRTNHIQIALNSDWVVTTEYESWHNNKRLDDRLIQANFKRVKEYQVGQSVKYVVWQK